MGRWLMVATCLALGCAPTGGDGGADAPNPPTAPAWAPTATRDGFSFANYRNEGVVNLGPAEMVRLFGDRVCVPSPLPGCRLTFNTRRWMDRLNRAMDAGHCFGMAATSLMLSTGPLTPADFDPAAETTYDLALEGNTALQQQIAYAYALQELREIWSRDYGNWGVRATPAQVVAHIEEGMAAGERYVLGLAPRGGGGHAITAFGVRSGPEEHLRHIVAYDNNFPGQEVTIEVDLTADTWRYDLGAANPEQRVEVWAGDAGTHSLSALPVSAMNGLDPEQVVCPPSVCGVFDQAADVRRIIRVDSIVSDFVVSDDAGNRIGRYGGTLYDEIPDGLVRFARGESLWNITPPPIFDLPPGQRYAITLANAFAGEDDFPILDFGIEGAGFAAGVDMTVLAPDFDEMVARFEADAAAIEFDAYSGDVIATWFDVRRPDADWRIEMAPSYGNADGVVTQRAALTADGGAMTLQFTHDDPAAETPTFDIEIERQAPDGGEPDCFAALIGGGDGDDIGAGFGDEITIRFAEWDRDEDVVPVQVGDRADVLYNWGCDWADDWDDDLEP